MIFEPKAGFSAGGHFPIEAFVDFELAGQFAGAIMYFIAFWYSQPIPNPFSITFAK